MSALRRAGAVLAIGAAVLLVGCDSNGGPQGTPSTTAKRTSPGDAGIPGVTDPAAGVTTTAVPTDQGGEPVRGDLCPPLDQFVGPESLQAGVRAEPAITQGKGTTWVVSLKNVTDQPITLVFADGRAADVVLKQSGAEVYRWSTGRSFTQVMRCERIFAGGTVTYRITEQRPFTLAPGPYTASLIWVSTPNPADVTVPITVS